MQNLGCSASAGLLTPGCGGEKLDQELDEFLGKVGLRTLRLYISLISQDFENSTVTVAGAIALGP